MVEIIINPVRLIMFWLRACTDFGWVLCHQRTSSINECPDIRIHQEDKPACLLAVGSITKDDIELQLEALLKPVVDDKDYVIEADRMEDTDDKWKIKVGYQGIV